MRAIIAALGLVAGLLATIAGTASAAPGPLSGRLVYSDIFGGSGLYTISPDGAGRDHLVNDTGVYRPKWLPDASAVSFIVEMGHFTNRLDVVDPDGSNRRVLVGRPTLPAGWKGISTYDWSPDGTQLVLCLHNDNFDSRLYVSSPDGSTMDLVVRNACGPDWSSQDRILANRGQKFLEMDPDGGNLVTIDTGRQTADPEWSPDGARIVFMCGSYSHADICVIDADGAHLANLTKSDRIDWSPTWSPDGARIVWAPNTNTQYRFADLWRMRADGSAKTRLTDSGKIDEYEPDWNAFA